MTFLARSAEGRPLLGDTEGFVPLSAADPGLESVREALSRAAADDLPSVDDATASRVTEEGISFGAPLSRFGKLWGIGLNYADHAADLDEVRPDEPASFMKPATALVGPGGPIRLPPESESERVTAEAELGVVIGRRCRNVDESEVDGVVAGYVPVIDMTAEDVLERNPRFLTRAKSYDTFLVVGDRIVVGEVDLDSISVKTEVGEEVIAENTVDRMLFSPPELVAFHSRVMTLEPGDLISTGTPGAGVIRPGDRVRAEVEGIGSVEATAER
ncbi:fumarylacetoacetate hydrolase family protein [Natronorarus salvus]|uniref:fumarylacetoacetate hydrolase family protein n=1 Tax=Natronorarus salvus TaxID=3117733 RepID=UPI002F25FFC7